MPSLIPPDNELVDHGAFRTDRMSKGKNEGIHCTGVVESAGPLRSHLDPFKQSIFLWSGPQQPNSPSSPPFYCCEDETRRWLHTCDL